MVANIAMLYIIDNIEKSTAHEQDARLLRQQIALQSENYSALKKTIVHNAKQPTNLNGIYRFCEIY